MEYYEMEMRIMPQVDVFLSPSVQEFNVGVGDYGTEEERMNQITDVVAYELQRNGLTVARNSPDQRLAQVVAQANALSPRAYVAIHSNALNGTARGPLILVDRFLGKGQTLADDIYSCLSAITPAPGFGVREAYSAFNGQGYFELRYPETPAVLIEVSFHDNPDDAKFIVENIVEIGIAIAKGILRFFGKPYTPDSPEALARLRQQYDRR